ncbi:two-partner secretion domain-containing protein, partial [Chlorogloea sp. CCALA 695]|uniref:two-partner secretion domain-containing protein n=1 Tax=Chlorogloea sp. CCALA 695 TaxID=2107693 RepID=UPI000D05819F
MLRKAIPIPPKVVLLYGLGVLIFDCKASAQVVPDNTLPINSIVNSNDNTLVINGGTVAGDNLFHSFEQFTIPTGNSSYFNNASNIQNIFSRVTGLSASNIDGAIRANGTANLFLLNPNGIIFGPNASLNIGGSFIGSTADYFQFSDGNKFSATEPQTTPLLTVNTPIGLGFGLNPGQISMQGNGHELGVADPTTAVGSPLIGSSESPTGLKTAFGKSLALIGGRVVLDGGILTAPSGQIEIGSVDGGIVNLSLTPAGVSFDYNNVNNFRDIQLSKMALIDASGILNSQINIQSRNLYLNDGSLILISNFGDQTLGKISIDATESVVVTGVSDPSSLNLSRFGVSITKGILTQNLSTLKGADIAISSRNLIIQSNGTIATTTFSQGRGGDIRVEVLDSLKIMGNPPVNFLFLPSGIGSLVLSSGQGGNIELSGKNLFIQDGGLLTTQTWGSAKGGGIIGNFSEGMEISGGFAIDLASNSFIPSTFGTISIFNGDTGDISINTRQLRIKDGGRINATTAASGRAGSIRINATDFVEVTGRIPNSTGNALYNLSQIVSSATQNNSYLLQFLNLPNLPQGRAGDVGIDTNNLIVRDEGQISVINEGAGDAGEIKIGSSSIFLDTNGSITASSQSGQGGNIEIDSSDLLLMRRNSQISTNAGNAQAGGDGGQINI